MISTDWLPDIFLGVSGTLCLTLSAFGLPRRWFYPLAVVGSAAAWTACVLHYGYLATVVDPLACFSQVLVLTAGLLLILMASPAEPEEHAGERLGSVLLAILGTSLAVRAQDLVLLFLGLELLSLATYILLYLDREGPEYREAASKYFYLSILASAVFLYGLSFLYGLGGSLEIDQLAGSGSAGSFHNLLGSVALVFILGGIGFKIAAVPFHFYAPDVYQATSHRNAALLSALPKIAGMVVLVRLLLAVMLGGEEAAWQMVLALSILTMTLGNVIALWQRHLRRLLAYSAIAHAGYMLIGLTVAMTYATPRHHPWDGGAALLLYLLVYVVASLGVFTALGVLRVEGRPVETVEDVRGLALSADPQHRLVAWAVAAFLFSLAGIPPLAGFWGKLALFFSALDIGGSPGPNPAKTRLVVLAVVGVINAAIAAGYYLRVVGTMFFSPREERPAVTLRPAATAPLLAMVVCLVLVLVIGVAPGRWLQQTRWASPSLRVPTLTQVNSLPHADLPHAQSDRPN